MGKAYNSKWKVTPLKLLGVITKKKENIHF